jgi:hypothetical protein
MFRMFEKEMADDYSFRWTWLFQVFHKQQRTTCGLVSKMLAQRVQEKRNYLHSRKLTLFRGLSRGTGWQIWGLVDWRRLVLQVRSIPCVSRKSSPMPHSNPSLSWGAGFNVCIFSDSYEHILTHRRWRLELRCRSIWSAEPQM